MHTAIISTLERKGIITRAEGEKLVEFINNKPQPSQLADAYEQVSEIIDEPIKMPTGRLESKTAVEADQIDRAVKGNEPKKPGKK